MKEDQELLETEASTMRRHQSMQRLSRGELMDSHMDEELVRNMKFNQGPSHEIILKKRLVFCISKYTLHVRSFGHHQVKYTK
jgi:hypothetical protein